MEGYADVEELVEHADGFAEVFPEHKFLIVKILQVRQIGRQAGRPLRQAGSVCSEGGEGQRAP